MTTPILPPSLKNRVTFMNRRDLLAGLSPFALASCASESIPISRIGETSLLTPGGGGRTRMSLPSGYTTTTSNSGSVYTTNLYYQGTLVAAISANTTNYETTFYDYISNQHWTSTSPHGLLAGQTWNLASNASGTANSTGKQLSGVCGSASGYFYYAVDSTTGDYYSEHYHPTFYSVAQRINSGIYSGSGGNGCPPSGCPQSPATSWACVTGIVGLGFGALAMAAGIAGLFSGVLTPLAVAGLIGAHIEFLWAISMVYANCM